MTTKAAARQAILAGLGRGGVATTTSAGNVGGTTLVCTDFKSAALLAGAGTTSDYLDRAWIHVPSATAPKQARVTTNGITVASGTITLDVAIGSQIGSGIAFEWSPLMAPAAGTATGSGPSIEGALYEALRHLVFADEVSVAVATTADISLATWAAWLDRSGRLVQVLEPSSFSTSEAQEDAEYRGWELILDGETPKLRFTQRYGTASGNLTLKILRPADTWFRVSGTWTETAPGTALVAETDEVKPDLRHCREAGLVFAYQALAANREGPRRAEYDAAYVRQLGIARALPFWDATRDDLLPRPQAAPQAAPQADGMTEAA